MVVGVIGRFNVFEDELFITLNDDRMEVSWISDVDDDNNK